MSRDSSFWDRMAERYARRKISNEAVYQQKLDVTRRYLSPDEEVLELGCGTGSTAIALAPDVKHILAMDFSRNMLDIAEQRAEAQGVKNITFELKEIESLVISEGAFDAVLGFSILHLLDNRSEVIAKAYQLLKPGGVFVSSTAVLGDSSWFLRLVLVAGNKIGLLPPIRFITVQALEKNVMDAGFCIVHKWVPEQSRTIFLVAKKPE